MNICKWTLRNEVESTGATTTFDDLFLGIVIAVTLQMKNDFRSPLNPLSLCDGVATQPEGETKSFKTISPVDDSHLKPLAEEQHCWVLTH